MALQTVQVVDSLLRSHFLGCHATLPPFFGGSIARHPKKQLRRRLGSWEQLTIKLTCPIRENLKALKWYYDQSLRTNHEATVPPIIIIDQNLVECMMSIWLICLFKNLNISLKIVNSIFLFLQTPFLYKKKAWKGKMRLSSYYKPL